MAELDLLEAYLKDKGVPYSRTESQIIVYDRRGRCIWDAVCSYGSYGYEQGLLEVMGDPVVRWSDGDSVAGYLTAQNVIDRWEESRNAGISY